MNLFLDSDQELIRDSAAAYFGEEMPVTRLHQCEVFGEPARKALAGMGWLGMGFSEAQGGAGCSAVEEMLVFREAGRVLASPDYLFLVAAAHVAAEAGDEALTIALLAGDHGVALATPDQGPDASDSQMRLFGAEDASFALTLGEDRAALVALPETREPRLSLDKSVNMALAELPNRVAVVSVRGSGPMRIARLLAAAMLQGAAEAMRDMIVEYAKIRETFGRPIGAYQAVRHPCADMALRAEAARCQLFVASLSLRDARSDCALQIDAAKLIANSAAVRNADSNIQLHGGIGVTDEHDAPLFLKRVHMLSRWFGSDKSLLRRIVETQMQPTGTGA